MATGVIYEKVDYAAICVIDVFRSVIVGLLYNSIAAGTSLREHGFAEAETSL